MGCTVLKAYYSCDNHVSSCNAGSHAYYPQSIPELLVT